MELPGKRIGCVSPRPGSAAAPVALVRCMRVTSYVSSLHVAAPLGFDLFFSFADFPSFDPRTDLKCGALLWSSRKGN